MNIKSIFDKRIEEFIIVATMIVMVFLMAFQSTSRYVTGNSLSWGSELAQYLHVWQIWIGASLAVRMQAHIRVDVFIKLFPKKIQRVFNVIGIICWGVFAGFLAYEGTKYVSDVFTSGQSSPSLHVPMWIPYLAIPIGGTLMLIRLIQQLYFIFTNKDYTSESEEIQ